MEKHAVRNFTFVIEKKVFLYLSDVDLTMVKLQTETDVLKCWMFIRQAQLRSISSYYKLRNYCNLWRKDKNATFFNAIIGTSAYRYMYKILEC